MKLPYTIRFLFGTNEETGMNDVPYYRERYADPAFLFTPDAEFPVCYGEKGGFDATVVSAPIEGGEFLQFEGGSATNAVAGQAFCVVNRIVDNLPEAPGITVTYEEGKTRIDAKGKSAHASTPELGQSAIGLLADYVLANGIGTLKEQEFLRFVQKVVDFPDGSGVGIATADEYFGPLTLNGGTIKLEDGRFTQTLDSRWPTSTTPEEITAAITAITDPMGASFENTLLMVPFLVKPDTAPIQALLSAYNEVTGESREPFTIGGGTYAREFTSGASFGPEMPWIEYPEWAGSMHGPDEAISNEQLQLAFKIYAAALLKLEQSQL